jgi:predicted nucleic acid-binding protein
MVRAVVDTNVLFEGLTTLGDCSAVVDAWVARKFTPCVSVAVALEYEEVLTNKLGPRRTRQALAALQALLDRAEFVPIYFRTRPLSPDADDDFVIECAFNASASIVTRNVRDLRIAEDVLRIPVVTPESFVKVLE